LNLTDVLLAFVYVLIWVIDGFNCGRIVCRFYREEKLQWLNGKFSYGVDWILSVIFTLGSAFVLGKLDDLGNFDDIELLGPLGAIIALVLSIRHFRDGTGNEHKGQIRQADTD
jgi:hypothetical protein